MVDIETKQNNSTGFKKAYYNFMQRLTGKRSIKSYEVAPRNNTGSNAKPEQTTAENITATTTIPTLQGNNGGTLEQIIKQK